LPHCAENHGQGGGGQRNARREVGTEGGLMKATLAVDTTGVIRMWSRDAEALLGYSESEAVGQSIELIIPPHLRGRHHAGFGRYVQTGVSHLPEVAISPAVHKTGTIVKLQISVRPVYDESQKIVAVEALMSPLPAGVERR
jgi:PAS domain S-box-containing protein